MVLPSFLKSASPTTITALLSLLVDGVQGLPGQVPAVSSNDTLVGSIVNGTQGITGFPPCDALINAGLSHAVLLPSAPTFQKTVDASYSLTSRRAPWCFVLPSTPAEVSKVVTTLRDAANHDGGDWQIAARAGGHSAGQLNNVAEGVTIDLSQLNKTTYDQGSNVASYQTGARWGSVYEELAKHNVLVPGGREADVGVGGFTIGGGISWYTQRVGFTCDSAVNFEVVLANGDIVNANKSSNADLWKALKGGSGNFGIVTRFDLEAIPAQNLTTETIIYDIAHQNDLVKAVIGLAHNDRTHQDSAVVPMLSYAGGNVTMMVKQVNTANNWNTTDFDTLNTIPSVKIQEPKASVDIVGSVTSTSLPAGGRGAGGAYTIAADPRIMNFAIDEHARLVESLTAYMGPKNFTTLADFQPFPKYIADNSVQRGGNMMGLSNCTDRIICVMSAGMVDKSDSANQYSGMAQRVSAAIQRVHAYAKSIGMDEEFIYLNYADASQNPLGAYGKENIEFMKEVAKKYDSEGFFQNKVPFGFKVSKVSA